MAICCYCINPHFRTDEWKVMREHYKELHPTIKRPDKLYTKEWRTKRRES